MGRPNKKKPTGKPVSSQRARKSKYSRPLTKGEIEGIAFMLSGGEERLAKREAAELKKNREAAERKKKQEATKAQIKERRLKKKPLTEKKKEGIKLTMRNVLRDIVAKKERTAMEGYLFGSPSSKFRLMVREYPEQFKEVMKEPEMRPIIREVLKKVGKRK